MGSGYRRRSPLTISVFLSSGLSFVSEIFLLIKQQFSGISYSGISYDESTPPLGEAMVTSSTTNARELAMRATSRSTSQSKGDWVLIGPYIKRVRAELGMTLKQASEASGVAKSTISKIENDQLSPTFDVLQRLALGLGLEIAELLSGGAPGAMTRRSITRKLQGKLVETKEYLYEALATDIKKKRLIPFKATVTARAFDEFGGWVRHDGEEFVYVLSGSVRIYTEFYEPADLSVGDSIYIDSEMGHVLVSLSEEDATLIWVCTQVSL